MITNKNDWDNLDHVVGNDVQVIESLTKQINHRAEGIEQAVKILREKRILSSLIISPTGDGVRKMDAWGEGRYGAPRGDRIHTGADYEGKVGQDIVASITGEIIREAKPYKAFNFSGVLIEGKQLSIMMFYFALNLSLIGKYVEQGQVIGKLQDISTKYPGITPQIHLQVESINPEILRGIL